MYENEYKNKYKHNKSDTIANRTDRTPPTKARSWLLAFNYFFREAPFSIRDPEDVLFGLTLQIC